MSGTLVREEDITVGGIAGKERRWENRESQTVIFRADNLKFEGKQYRFEMFGAFSRKVKMEREWESIMKSVQFEKGSEERNHCNTAGTTIKARISFSMKGLKIFSVYRICGAPEQRFYEHDAVVEGEVSSIGSTSKSGYF